MINFSRVPNDRRGFLHRRLLRGVTSFVSSGFSPTAAAAGFLAPTRRPQTLPVRRPAPRTLTARPSRFSAEEKEEGRQLKFAANVGAARGFRRFRAPGDCVIPGMRRDPVTGECKFFLGTKSGRDRDPLETGPGVPVGDAVMGRFGAALTPGSRIIDRAICLPGMVIAVDGLCYNKKQIRNSERMWPRGRRPLLTGGDMRAISIASRAANRLTRTAVRLQEMGLIKKPVARKPRKKKS